MNNAVEAFPNEKGNITVSVRNYGDKVTIIIQDSGKGIPEHILKKLGEIGVTHSKDGTQSGSGLGVYHAKKTVEEAGGSFQIQSREGSGTIITITFRKASAPKWFVERLTLSPDMTIASLDDDISIHQIWEGRFESNNTSDFGIKHSTFTSGHDFKNWVTSQTHAHDAKSERLYLVDYELLNQNSTGLDIIEELSIGSNAILVTSRYEEDNIRERCERLNVRLIPKAMAGFVPIEITKEALPLVESNIRYDLCLLDDDKPLVQTIWAMVAKTKGHNIKIFSTPEEFQSASDFINRETPIFIDVSLGNGVSGVDFAEEVHKMGFLNINLATGYSADSIKAPSFIGRIIGKDYPEVI